MPRPVTKGSDAGQGVAGRPALRVLPPAPPRAPGTLPGPSVGGLGRQTAGAALLVAGASLVARAALQRRRNRRAAEASRNRAFAELLSAVRQRDEALSSAAHDLRTPLTTLKGQAQLLQRFLRAVDGPDAERLRAGLAAIDAAATTAAARIDRLADEGAGRPGDR
jgi:signal transduction histidine kinase